MKMNAQKTMDTIFTVFSIALIALTVSVVIVFALKANVRRNERIDAYNELRAIHSGVIIDKQKTEERLGEMKYTFTIDASVEIPEYFTKPTTEYRKFVIDKATYNAYEVGDYFNVDSKK